MDQPAVLVDELHALLWASPRPAAEFHEQLLKVQQVIRGTIPSFMGLRLTATVNRATVVLQLLEDKVDRRVGSSLWIPLSEPGGPAVSDLVIFAGTAGALVDLAADMAYAWPRAEGVALDQHLDDLPPQSELSGVEEFSLINRAIGVLIERGLEPDDALDALCQVAVRTRKSLVAVASDVSRVRPEIAEGLG